MTEPAAAPTEHTPPSRRLPTPRRAPLVERVFAGGVSLACLSVLIVASTLDPADRGHGTHTQLGLLPCSWAVSLERPCPTCGMTTSFAYAAGADFAGAFQAQPFGALLAILTATAFWVSLHIAATGSRLAPLGLMLLSPKALIFWGVALAAGWAYKLASWGG